MDFNDINELRESGFDGFRSIAQLWLDKSCVPKQIGVYLVLNPDYQNPQFICPGVGGFFKGEDPNVSIDTLRSNIVDNSQVVYIGKAGKLRSGNANLNSRIAQYLKFGQGRDIGHWGGRYIWQLQNHMHLLICWKVTPNDEPRQIEKQLIGDYLRQFNKKPFANLTS